MADRFLTLLDITKRDNCDEAIGLIEEVNTVAPEIALLMGRPINGTTYLAKRRKALPAGPIFRNANEGVDVVSSQYEQVLSQCFFLDGQLQIDEAILQAGKGSGNSQAAILADESSGIMQQKAISLGDQFYRGTTADAKGFVGLQGLYGGATSAYEVDVTGSTSGSRSSAWLIWNHPQGVHWIFGNNSGLMLGEWFRQQVLDSSNKKFIALCNNLSGYIGLGFGHTKSIIRIKNIENTSGKYLTDAHVADALSKMPGFMESQPGLRLLMNRTARLTLQKSRSTVNTSGTQKTDSGILQFAPLPTESNGIPIIVTDSLPQTE